MGYDYLEGVITGWGSHLGSKLKLNISECAKRCDAEPECLSIEHMNVQMLCDLNTIALPNRGPYYDQVLCRKQGKL